MKIKFTPTEAAIIQHRLGVPDALADCLEEQFTSEQVEAACEELNETIKGEFDYMTLSEVEREVLIDCAEGSTALASLANAMACGDVTKGWGLAQYRAAGSLEAKLTAAAGRSISIPRA